MKNILYITDYKEELSLENLTVLSPEELNKEDAETDAVIIGKIDTVYNAELAKKYIIDKKIKGAFITVSVCLGNDGKLNENFDKSMIKKMKEVCLFADLIILNYTEATLFSNIPYSECCGQKEIKRIIFMLNSYGMVNKLIITGVPVENEGPSTIISELEEYEVVSENKAKEELSVAVTKELLNGSNLKNAFNNLK